MKTLDKAIKACDTSTMGKAAIREIKSYNSSIAQTIKRHGDISSSDISKYKKLYNEVLDYHMDGDISKSELNRINTDLVNELKAAGASQEIIRDFGWR